MKRLKATTADLAAYWLLNAVLGFLLVATFGGYPALEWGRFCLDVTEISAISFAIWLVLNVARLRFMRPPAPLSECDICGSWQSTSTSPIGVCAKYPYACDPVLSKKLWFKSLFIRGK